MLPPLQKILVKTKLNAETGCLEWQGAVFSHGYGAFRIHGKTVRVHKYIWETYRGVVPKGFELLHECNNKLCVNLSHIKVGTHKENMSQAERDGLLPFLNPEKFEGWKARIKPRFGENNGKARLTKENVKVIKSLLASHTDREIAAMFHVHHTTIYYIRINKTWKDNDDGLQ